MDCPRPIKSVLPRFHPTMSSPTRPSKGQRVLDRGYVHVCGIGPMKTIRASALFSPEVSISQLYKIEPPNKETNSPL